MKVSDITVEWLEHMGIPRVHWKVKFIDIPDKCSHKKAVRSYLDKIRYNVLSGKGLLLWGDYGRGKSALAAICLVHAAANGFIGHWIKAKEIPKHVIEQTPFDDELTMYERAQECPLLVIDEFQIRYEETKYTEWSAEDLVRSRIDQKLATIMTTNVPLRQIEASYPAFYSVLQEGLYPIKVQGHDFRRAMVGG
jgi:DNA replication protein DnaC